MAQDIKDTVESHTGLLDRWMTQYNAMTTRIRARKVRPPTPAERFARAMETAQGVIERNPRGLPSLLRALLRPLQSRYLLGVAELGQDAYPPIGSPHFFGSAVHAYLWERGEFRGERRDPSGYLMRLNRDTVLPWPWSESSYEKNLAMIGSEKQVPVPDGSVRRYDGGPWVQHANHRVELWLPWGIGFVSSGNHSIAAGILAGEGELVPDDVRDLSYVLDEVRFDGERYVDIKRDRPLGPAPDWSIGAAFEVGRLMVEHGVPSPIALMP